MTEAFLKFISGIPAYGEMSDNMQHVMKDFFFAGYIAALNIIKENQSERSESGKVAE